jgi:mannose-6-phosphate isomerase-like protein (cupin superfamily)
MVPAALPVKPAGGSPYADRRVHRRDRDPPAARCCPPRHIHAHEEEVVYILEGRILFETVGRQIPTSAGSCVVLPRGSEQSYRIESDEARLLIFIAPAGLEAYYRELHQPDTHGSVRSEIERVVTLAARFGLTTTGPGC